MAGDFAPAAQAAEVTVTAVSSRKLLALLLLAICLLIPTRPVLAAPPSKGPDAGSNGDAGPAAPADSAAPAASDSGGEGAARQPEGAGAAAPPSFEKAIDDGAGVVVKAMAGLLFYPVLASTSVHEGLDDKADAATVAAMVAALEADGVDVGGASLTLHVPAARYTADEAAAIERELQAKFVPTEPFGVRRFTVARDEEAKHTKLEANTAGIPVIVLWLVFGSLFFTLRMGFINLRAFGHAIAVTRGDYDNPDDEGEVSHFQALASALSATVGLGNIAGVAIAVAVGGPGAVFWLVVAGLLGMSTKFVECTLGQKYRQVSEDHEVSGGPMYYLSKGLESKGLAPLGTVLAVLFTIMCIGGSLAGGNSFQVNQSLGILKDRIPALADYGWVYGLVMVALVGIVIIGGIKRIASTAEKIVPLMCGIYVLACIWVVIMNAAAVPAAFGSIIGQAFTPAAGYGGFVGVLVTGFRRAAFSNEAGVGSASIAHSAARTEYPVREGIVALLEPFIDTVVVCTMTGIVIVVTGAYADPANAELIAAANGSALTSRAFGGQISWFPWVLMVAVFLFAYSTMISWSYYGERAWTFLFGRRSAPFYKVLFLVFVFLGSVVQATNVLEFGDLMILSMALPNILGVLILSGDVRRDLDVYMRDLAEGRFVRYTRK